ncbi:MAG: hypothetical protein ACTHOG_08825, partial [Marmoricola sp.]
LLDATAAHVRALALAALGIHDGAAEALRAGVALAREKSFAFDLAQMLVSADSLGLTDLGETGEAEAIFERVGVQAAR